MAYKSVLLCTMNFSLNLRPMQFAAPFFTLNIIHLVLRTAPSLVIFVTNSMNLPKTKLRFILHDLVY